MTSQYPNFYVNQDLFDRELELEGESLDFGITRYRTNRDKRGESNTYVGSKVIGNAVEEVSQRIVQWLDSDNVRKNGSIAWFLRLIDPEVVALAGLKVVVDSMREESPLTTCAVRTARLLETHLDHEKVRHTSQGYYDKVVEGLKGSTSERHRKKVMEAAARALEVDQVRLDESDRVKVGRTILDHVVQTTGLVELRFQTQRGGHSSQSRAQMLVPTQRGIEWIEESHSKAERMYPMRMPMIHPPRNWTNPWNGGYLTSTLRRVAPLVIRKTGQRRYLQELSKEGMPDVYAAVNAMQNTRWHINSDVLRVFEDLWNRGSTVADLPHRDPRPLPAKPPDIEYNEESRAQWRHEAAAVHEANAMEISKRAATAQVLWIAQRLREEEAIYFPHQLDWRGRTYPIPPLLNPQSSDLGKGLLHFADSKRLGESGEYWFKVHLANLFGVDKVSYEERIAWVDANRSRLEDSGRRPTDGEMFWTEADDPWQALAGCFEYVGYLLHGREHRSSLPIAVDGTCSGLQHFSALLRDSRGARAVNLIPMDQPQDIYNEVAVEVNERLQDRADEPIKDQDHLAQKWAGHVNRKMVKRPTMTQPYGVTRYGMVGQLREEIPGDTSEAHFQANYLATFVHNAIGNTVVAARTAMDWLQEMARQVAADDLPVWWETPVGFVVKHDYWEVKMKEVRAAFAGVRVQSKFQEYTDKISKKDMARGIAPNYVHSMDAAHLMLTVSQLAREGYEHFAMVHDSFGMHACDVGRMQQCLRRQFVWMYSMFGLKTFYQQIEEQLPGDMVENIPALPQFGDLDLEQTLNSPYFFG